MDENGVMKKDFALQTGDDLKLEIVNDAIRITTKDEKETGVKVTAQSAIDLAVQGGQLDSAASVKLLTREGKKVWRVIGMKDQELTNVYVDVTTGGIVAVE
jgi:hypothetical protein